MQLCVDSITCGVIFRAVFNTFKKRSETSVMYSICIMLLEVVNVMLLCSVRSLVRILKDMQKHVPGLQHLDSWYIQLLVCCWLKLFLIF